VVSRRFFLIPSKQGHTPSYQILEHGIYVDVSDYKLPCSFSIHAGQRVPAPIHQNLPIGVDPSIALQWLEIDSQIDYDFTTIQNLFNIEIGCQQIRNFKKTISFSSKYLENSSALGVVCTIKYFHGYNLGMVIQCMVN